jgi:hypothetical protein
MDPRSPPNEATDDGPVNVDAIYNNLGLDQDADPGFTNLEEDTSENVGEGTGTPQPVSNQAPAPGSENTPAQTPSQPQPSDVDALRRQNDQLTRTYIPALERERDRALANLQDVQRSVQGLQQFREHITSHGLSPDEATIGLQMAAAYKTNPVDFITKLIRNAQASGITMPEGVPNTGLDPNTISRIIDQRLQPLLAPIQARQQEDQQSQAITTHINEFYRDYPDARVQEKALAKFISHASSQGRRVSLANAYIELYKWSAANGLDWSQPLEAQVAARQANQNSNPPQQQPNLGTSRRTIQPQQVNNPTAQYNPNMSWKSIIQAERAAQGRG